MTSLLGFTYSTKLTEDEKAAINQTTAKAREEFWKGFSTGSKISVAIYAFYLVTSATKAFAADPPLAPKTPGVGDNRGIQPTPKAKPASVKPSSRPGFKPVSEATRGTYIGGATAICSAAVQSGDFFLGLGCAFLLVVGGIILNRPPEK